MFHQLEAIIEKSYIGLVDGFVKNLKVRVFIPATEEDYCKRSEATMLLWPEEDRIRRLGEAFFNMYLTRGQQDSIFAWPTLERIVTGIFAKQNKGIEIVPHKLTEDEVAIFKLDESIPDLNSRIKNCSRVIIMSHGVMCNEISHYNQFLSALAARTNACIIVPMHEDGTSVGRSLPNGEIIGGFDTSVRMFQNNIGRKRQMKKRNEELFALAEWAHSVKKPSAKVHGLGHSLGGGAIIHLLADNRAGKYFDSIVGLGPTLSVGFTDADWSHILNYKPKVPTLQVHEDQYYSCPRKISYALRLAQSNPDLHKIVTVKDCNHLDLTDNGDSQDMISIYRNRLCDPSSYSWNPRQGFMRQLQVTANYFNDPDHFMDGLETDAFGPGLVHNKIADKVNFKIIDNSMQKMKSVDHKERTCCRIVKPGLMKKLSASLEVSNLCN